MSGRKQLGNQIWPNGGVMVGGVCVCVSLPASKLRCGVIESAAAFGFPIYCRSHM